MQRIMEDEKQYDIPPAIKRAIDLHEQEGRTCGSFVTALLQNDLREAVGRADRYSMDAMKEIMQYLDWEIQGRCWGSPSAVKEWRECGGLKRIPKGESGE